MAANNDSWGIEVGANAIKALHLVRRGSNVLVADYVHLPFRKVLTAPKLDADAAIQSALNQLLSRYDLAKSTVMMSVPGNVAFAKFAKLPPVEPKKILDMVGYEAVQQIPFPIDDVEWDYQVFSQTDSPDVEVGIFAITKERVSQILGNYHAVGLRVDGLTLSSLAVYNAMAYDLALTPESPGLMFVDVGTSATNVIIVDRGTLWLRTFRVGGNSFTEALVRSFKLSFSKAEKLKREVGTSKYTRQISQAMRPVYADLVQELQKTMGYYMSMNRDARLGSLIGMGSTFRIPGLQKILKQQLQMEVTHVNGFNRISVEGKDASDFVDRSLNMATAYGLALQGLGLETVNANILPATLIRQRIWKQKQPWFAAAAALVVSASIAAWGALIWARHTYASALEQHDPMIQSVMTRAQQYKDQWKQIEGQLDPRHQIEVRRRMLAYREVWPQLIQDLLQALASVEPQEGLLSPGGQAEDRVPRGQRRRLYISSIDAVYHPPTSDSRASSGVEPVASPAFVITVRGTTPYHDATRLINDHVVTWFKEGRSDRPYRFVNPGEALVSMTRVTAADADKHRRAGERAGRRSGSVDLGPWLPNHPLASESREGDSLFELRWEVQLQTQPQATETVKNG